MTEKININGKDIWIVIDPHVADKKDAEPREYFTASYHAVEPTTDPGGNIFLDSSHKPVLFSSPVEALEYASERLLETY